MYNKKKGKIKINERKKWIQARKEKRIKNKYRDENKNGKKISY